MMVTKILSDYISSLPDGRQPSNVLVDAFCGVGVVQLWLFHPIIVIPYLFRAYRIWRVFDLAHKLKRISRDDFDDKIR